MWLTSRDAVPGLRLSNLAELHSPNDKTREGTVVDLLDRAGAISDRRQDKVLQKLKPTGQRGSGGGRMR